MCALAMSASPALALNKGRLLSGVEQYSGTNDGTITSTFVSTPTLAYTLQITSKAYASGIAGVNAPKALAPGGGNKGVPPVGGVNLITVNNFSSYTCQYTTPTNHKIDHLLTAVVQDAATGLFFGAEGKSVNNSGVFSFTAPASAFQANGLPSGATVVLGDIVFQGGSNKRTESVTLSEFAINGSNTVSVDNGFFVFDTQPDSRFNFTPL